MPSLAGKVKVVIVSVLGTCDNLTQVSVRLPSAWHLLWHMVATWKKALLCSMTTPSRPTYLGSLLSMTFSLQPWSGRPFAALEKLSELAESSEAWLCHSW